MEEIKREGEEERGRETETDRHRDETELDKRNKKN